MTVETQSARVSRPKESPGRIGPQFAALVLVSVAVCCSTALQSSARSAEPAGRPNIVFILADDKYESTGPKPKNLRENRQNTAFPA